VADILLSWGSRGGRREPDDDFGVFVVVVERPIVWRRRLGGVDGAISRAWRRMFILSRSSTMRPLSACSLMLML
jgi:hypothetical protein